MNKISIVLLALLVVAGSAYYWWPEATVNDPQWQKYQDLVVNPKLNKAKKTKRYDQPHEAAEWWGRQLVSRDGHSPAHLNVKYRDQILKQEQIRAQQLLSAASAADIAGDGELPNLKFEELGPGVFGGRIRAMVIKPDDPNVLLTGGVSGGVWKSTNGGESWEAKADFLPNIAINSMIIDPDNPNRVFAGTGEGFFNFDLARGAGIFVSENFGESWQQLDSTLNNNFLFVNRLAMVQGTDIILAATQVGIFRSTNLGNSWQEVSNFTTAGRGFVDIKTDPINPNRVLAVHYGNPNDAIQLVVTSPASLAGGYNGVPAAFGPAIDESGVSGVLTPVDDGVGTGIDACEAISDDLTGLIALIERGGCNFTVKVKNAQDAGAVAAVVYQSDSSPPFAMGGTDDTITIPSLMISRSQGLAFANFNGSIDASLSLVVRDDLQRFVMRSTNAGQTWEVLDDHGLPASDVGRMELGFGQDGVVYVAVANGEDQTRGLWRSDGALADFEQTPTTSNFIIRQGWYDLAIGVKPDDSDVVFAGAVDAFRTVNGGLSMSQTSYWSPQPGPQVNQFVHADHHGYVFDPQDPNTMYALTDGGIYKTTDNGDNFVSLNNGLGISQSYGIAVHPNGELITSGTQDNGSQIFFGNTNAWLEWRGGDGGYSAWDKQNPNFVYGSNPNGDMFGSSNGGLNTTNIELPDTDGSSFIQPFTLNDLNGNEMMVGTDNVFYSGNVRDLGNATWTDVSGNASFGRVSTMTFSPVNNGEAFAGGENGRIYRINNLGTTNTVTEITINSSNGGRDNIDFITDIVVDASDNSGNTMYVTMAFYDGHRIYKTTDGGSSWESIAGNLPDIPLFRVSIDPTDPNRLFLGSELGVWTTNSTEAGDDFVWTRYDYGPAFTRIVDLVWSDDNTLYIGTHGRGTYRASRDILDVSLNQFTVTNSSCDRDKFLDIGETGLLLVDITNNGGADAIDVEATLNGELFIDINTPTATLGTIAPGQTVTASFSISLTGTVCVNNESLEVMVSSDNGTFTSMVEVPLTGNSEIQLGTFSDGAEDLETSQMVPSLDFGIRDWERVTDQVNSGTGSWFIADENRYADKSLQSPWLTMGPGGNVLSFAMRYITEGDSQQYWDGVILELRTETMDWQDIGQLSTVAYDGLLFVNNTAPGRPAWSGSQPQWRNAEVDLGDEYLGQKVQFRFRMISDFSVGAQGYWLDDISMSNVYFEGPATCDACQSAATNSTIPFSGLWFDPARLGQGFFIEPVLNTESYFGTFYTRDSTGRPEWFVFSGVVSNGVLNMNMDPGTLQRFLLDLNAGPNVGNPTFPDPNTTNGVMTIDFDSTRAAAASVCQDGHPDRVPTASAVMTYQIEGESASWCIQPLISETNKAEPDLSGIWFAGQDDGGWGLSIVLSKDQLVVGLYYYDADGRPRWSIGQAGGYEAGRDLIVQMTEIPALGSDRNDLSANPVFVNNGTLSIRLDNATQILSIDGIISFNVEYQGASGGSWVRTNLPITIFTEPHD